MAWNPPATFAVDEILTAAKLNQVAESLAYLHGDAGAIALNDALSGLTLLHTNGASATRAKLWGSNGALSTTAQIIIPDGAGDVTQFAWAYGFYFEPSNTYRGTIGAFFERPGYTSSVTSVGTSGTNVNFRINANGAVDIYTSAGATTFNLALIVLWR